MLSVIKFTAMPTQRIGYMVAIESERPAGVEYHNCTEGFALVLDEMLGDVDG